MQFLLLPINSECMSRSCLPAAYPGPFDHSTRELPGKCSVSRRAFHADQTHPGVLSESDGAAGRRADDLLGYGPARLWAAGDEERSPLVRGAVSLGRDEEQPANENCRSARACRRPQTGKEAPGPSCERQGSAARAARATAQGYCTNRAHIRKDRRELFGPGGGRVAHGGAEGAPAHAARLS